MKKILIGTILMLMVGLLAGCATTNIPTAEFRGHKIVVGQAIASVEAELGAPNYITSNYLDMVAFRSQPFAIVQPPSSNAITEWVYIDKDISLVLWHGYGNVGVIWLIKTESIRNCAVGFDARGGRKVVVSATCQ